MSRHAQYHLRKSQRKCVECGAGLQPEDGTRCVEHAATTRASNRRYRARYPERVREMKRKEWASDPAKRNAYERARRLAHKVAGICVECTQPASETSVRCEWHRETNRVRTLRRWRKSNRVKRKRAFLPSNMPRRMPKELRAQRAMQEHEPDVDGAVDSELHTTRNRLLRALRFLDWARVVEVVEAAELETDWINSAQLHLLRLHRAGLAERRGAPTTYEYRITPAGRAEVERLIKSTIREAA